MADRHWIFMVVKNLLDRQTVKEIFWDRPEMTPEILMEILGNPASAKYYQVGGRMVAIAGGSSDGPGG